MKYFYKFIRKIKNLFKNKYTYNWLKDNGDWRESESTDPLREFRNL